LPFVDSLKHAALFRAVCLAGHPRFFNQISSGLDMVGLAAAWVTAVANTDMYVYTRTHAISPTTLMVHQLVGQLSLLPYAEREMSTGQSAVTLCRCGVMTGWLIPHLDKRVCSR